MGTIIIEEILPAPLDLESLSKLYPCPQWFGSTDYSSVVNRKTRDDMQHVLSLEKKQTKNKNKQAKTHETLTIKNLDKDAVTYFM